MKNLLTLSCYKKIKIDLEKLIKEKKNLINEIKKAKENGDLSENSEYKSAKNRQRIIDSKIREIKNLLSNYKIVKKKNCKNVVKFLDKVKLLNLNNNEIKIYKLVNNEMADIKLGLISIDSNLAKLLLGKSKNEVIELKKIKNSLNFKILEII